MQKAEKRLHTILNKIKNSDIPYEDLLKLDVIQTIRYINPYSYKNKFVFFMLFVVFLCYICYSPDSECFIQMPQDGSKIFREPEDCEMCINVNEVDKVHNISPASFEKSYANVAKPVVVIDGTNEWPAVKTFSFGFFKELYLSTSNDGFRKTECQFFPYKTEFRSLLEALNMSTDRSNLKPGTLPWYIGWSNCNDHAGNVLRKHYDRPYFLPEKSETIALNWIFMGGPGFGAHMHVDNVQYPSWQAQLRGRKIWRLAPPPECFYRCKQLEVTVNPGEIIVVDTNRWYHQTYIEQGDISITIGAEFD